MQPVWARRRDIVLAGAGLLASTMLPGPASAETSSRKAFRAVTTFTVIQDIAQNVAGDRAMVESITQAGRRDPRLSADAA